MESLTYLSRMLSDKQMYKSVEQLKDKIYVSSMFPSTPMRGL
ncbi:5758_t:CDS:1, partial [Funneliformis mosseae]